jgi:hypothetical protein
MKTTYRYDCPCGQDSPCCASLKVAERWYVEHLRAQHPDAPDTVIENVLAGKFRPTRLFGDLSEAPSGFYYIATCAACPERVCETEPEDAENLLKQHWIAAHKDLITWCTVP